MKKNVFFIYIDFILKREKCHFLLYDLNRVNNDWMTKWVLQKPYNVAVNINFKTPKPNKEDKETR